MWHDIETTDDILNFTSTAESVAELIVNSPNTSLSIGVSGSWGSGKSSLVKMIGDSIRRKDVNNKYCFLEFNAWLYQGYEDARTSLLQVVADRLEKEVRHKKSAQSLLGKISNFRKRINWLKLCQFSLPTVSHAALGFTIGGPLGAVAASAFNLIKQGKVSDETLREIDIAKTVGDFSGVIRDESEAVSIDKSIQELRLSFFEILNEIGVNLVIQVDDLDRCLPNTAISTLEALRLLLFTDNTIFLIAADEEMIRNSLRNHFKFDITSEHLVTNYFDKLIQIPIQVPKPGFNEIKAYSTLLLADIYVREGKFKLDDFNKIKKNITSSLPLAWKKGLTREHILPSINEPASTSLEAIIDIAEQLTPLLLSSSKILGNPRLVKRFFNNYLIKNLIAKSQQISIPIDIFIKLMLLERCVKGNVFNNFAAMILKNKDGKWELIKTIEDAVRNGEIDKASKQMLEEWEADFMLDWFSLKPNLSDIDLRPFFYLARESTANYLGGGELSKEAERLFSALMSIQKRNSVLSRNISALPNDEIRVLFARSCRKSQEEQYDSTSILRVYLVTEAHDELRNSFLEFLDGIPKSKIPVNIIPYLKKDDWATALIEKWKTNNEISSEVKSALAISIPTQKKKS